MEHEAVNLDRNSRRAYNNHETGDEEDTMAENHPAERDALAESVSEKDRHHRFGAADEESDVSRALGGIELAAYIAASRVEPRAYVSSRIWDEAFILLWRLWLC